MTSLAGPRLTPGRYIRHPDDSSTYWQDGHTLDAGSGQVFDSNINWLVEQSCRHLAMDTFAEPGPMVNLNSVAETWANLSGWDVPEAPVFSASGPDDRTIRVGEISWERPFAHCCGPFVLIADRIVTDNVGASLRDVVVEIDYVRDTAPASELWLYAALSGSDSPPDVVAPWAFARKRVSSGTGQQQYPLTLSVNHALDAYADGATLVSRPAAGNAQVMVQCVVGYLWVAFVSVKLNPTDTPENYVYAINAYEVR
jgi:hypothetical protein